MCVYIYIYIYIHIYLSDSTVRSVIRLPQPLVNFLLSGLRNRGNPQKLSLWKTLAREMLKEKVVV